MKAYLELARIFIYFNFKVTVFLKVTNDVGL
uniref:Uncharacterized protein n=1 Tax=Tetranychus urticae TaxID=32264 RepID=T1JZZ4_TETUR